MQPVSRARQSGYLLLMALVLLLAFGLRVYRLDHQSLWYDEGNSIALAARSIPAVIAGASADIHPPGYYLLLHFWGKLTGLSTEFAARYLSVLTGVLTTTVIALLGTRLFERKVGVLAALLVASNPLQIYYAQEARMYGLVTLWSAASILLTAEVLKLPGEMQAGTFNRRRAALVAIGYCVVNAAGLYTHYSYPFVIVAESLIFLLWLIPRKKKLHGLVVWAALQFGTLLLFAPQLPTAIRQLLNWPRGVIEAADLLTIAATMLYGITLEPQMVVIWGVPLLILALVGLLPPVTDDGRYLRFHERIALVVAWLLLPPLLMIAGQAMTTANLKFLLPPSLAFSLLAARGIVLGWRIGKPLPEAGGRPSPAFRGMVVVLLVAGLTPAFRGLYNLYYDPTYARDDYRGVAAKITAESGPDAGIVLVAPNQWEVLGFYYPDGPGITPLPAGTETEDQLFDLLARYERVYAVYWGEWQPDPERSIERTLEAHAFPVKSEWFGTVRLVTYAVPAPVATSIAVPVNAGFGEHITLAGYTLSASEVAPGNALGVTLFWEITEPTEDRYKVFVHLYAADGSIIAQHDAEPGNDLKPTWIWEPDTLISDGHGLLIPADLPPGTYQLVAGMYGAFDETRLPVMIDGVSTGDRLLLEAITIQ